MPHLTDNLKKMMMVIFEANFVHYGQTRSLNLSSSKQWKLLSVTIRSMDEFMDAPPLTFMLRFMNGPHPDGQSQKDDDDGHLGNQLCTL